MLILKDIFDIIFNIKKYLIFNVKYFFIITSVLLLKNIKFSHDVIPESKK